MCDCVWNLMSEYVCKTVYDVLCVVMYDVWIKMYDMYCLKIKTYINARLFLIFFLFLRVKILVSKTNI